MDIGAWLTFGLAVLLGIGVRVMVARLDGKSFKELIDPGTRVEGSTYSSSSSRSSAASSPVVGSREYEQRERDEYYKRCMRGDAVSRSHANQYDQWVANGRPWLFW